MFTSTCNQKKQPATSCDLRPVRHMIAAYTTMAAGVEMSFCRRHPEIPADCENYDTPWQNTFYDHPLRTEILSKT